jgi:hypothetical protein
MKPLNLIYCPIKDFILIAQNEYSPTNEEWDRMILAIKENSGSPPRAVIISSDGGSPNATQRKKLREALQEKQSVQYMRMAMFSESVIVRMALTALRNFIPTAPVVFSIKQWKEASLHLNLSLEEMRQAIEALNNLRKELDLSPLPTPK